MAILEERGLFWWNDERIPKQSFAPDSALGGLLKIDDNGNVRLELDACMPTGKHRPAGLFGRIDQAITRNIQGVLKHDNRGVLLTGLFLSGGEIKSRGISFEIYSARYCLVGETSFPADSRMPRKFRSLSVDLKGYEEWLRMGAIEVKRRRASLAAKYKKEKTVAYKTLGEALRIEYDMEGPRLGESRSHTLKLTEIASFRFSPKTAFTVEECQICHQLFQDLLILLTNSDYNLDWPQLTSADGKRVCHLYFPRNKSGASAPRSHECLTNFQQLRENFGRLFWNWRNKREAFGPAFYLYLGTRRGVKMYIEHRFVNLIWGLESFDRRAHGEAAVDPVLEETINRILGQISARKDKKCAKYWLKRATDLSLKDRLFRTFKNLPLPLDDERLREFCEDCADRRNEISHVGGGKSRYDAFLRDLDQKSSALSALYHVLLLQEIGLSAGLLDFRTNRSWSSSSMERCLQEAGLLKAGAKD